MKKKVAFVELTVFSGVVPLASGYMEACCRKDPSLVASFDYVKTSLAVKTPFEQILSTLLQTGADVYAFSCYVWNAGLVRRLLAALLGAKPQSHFILGGPQVMGQAERYLSPENENVFVCNGEGERTFPNFLRALNSPEPDFSAVRSLSFYRGGRLLTTPPEHRITDLSEIPSPFLEGLFDGDQYSWMLLETNRGCPFKCNYCYWGSGATGVKVFRYDDERVKGELEVISRSQCWYLFIADANWGMLKRDVELSEYIVECQRRYGAPLSVYFCGSKNTPDRVSEITRIFHEAGILSSQSVALQTMNPETLLKVNRDNIRTSAYVQVQQTLNQQGISSLLEMIWPLPGETLTSFQDGLAKLCEIGADTFVVYPLLLMNNVELGQKREEYGLVTIPDPDPNSEAEIVVRTREVDDADYREGLWYMYAVLTLYALRGLWHLGKYLNGGGAMPYARLFRAFIEYARQRPSHPWTAFCENSIRGLEYTTFGNVGALVHLTLHSHREEMDELMGRFVADQEFWQDPRARLFFEVDLINRPYVYNNTPIVSKKHHFTHLRVNGATKRGYAVAIPDEHREVFRRHAAERTLEAGDACAFEVDHRRSQLPFMPSKSLHEHYAYCHDKSHHMNTYLPLWRKADAVR